MSIAWKDFDPAPSTWFWNEQETNVRCPKCETLLWIQNVVVMSYPPKNKYVCHKCGWEGEK